VLTVEESKRGGAPGRPWSTPWLARTYVHWLRDDRDVPPPSPPPDAPRRDALTLEEELLDEFDVYT
jgi:hypothetical protein